MKGIAKFQDLQALAKLRVYGLSLIQRLDLDYVFLLFEAILRVGTTKSLSTIIEPTDVEFLKTISLFVQKCKVPTKLNMM